MTKHDVWFAVLVRYIDQGQEVAVAVAAANAAASAFSDKFESFGNGQVIYMEYK